MRLFGFLVLAVGGVVLLYLFAAPFWVAAVAALALLLAGWILGIGLWPPLGRFELWLRSPRPEVQRRALDGLKTLIETDYEKPIRRVRAMLQQVEADEDSEVREAARRLLARLDEAEERREPPHETAALPIEEETSTPILDRILREEATVSHVVSRLVEVLAEGDPDACRQVVDALVELGPPALPALVRAREGVDGDVRVDLDRAVHLIRGEAPLGA